ncbi:MAG TPA: DUF167 domain-containing protein [Dehalococcoidia bacterium]|nr:DUF167 domain-containing protein [Dehalococcoidia bacterium]
MGYLTLRVTPAARRDEIGGWYGHALRVRVAAPAERDKANEAVVRLLAQVLEVDRARIRIARGATSRDKLIEIEGLEDAEIRQLLDEAS